MAHRCQLCWLIPLAIALAGCDQQSSAEPGFGPVVLADLGDESCPHPFLPMVKGVTWTYDLGTETSTGKRTATLRVVDVAKKGGKQVATVDRVVGISKTQVEAVCSSRGTNFLGLFVPMGAPVPAAVHKAPRVTKREGTLLPIAKNVRPGGEWKVHLTARTELRGRAILTMDSLWEASGAFLREREVRVPAGRYKTRQVKLNLSVHHRPPEEEATVLSDRVMDPPPMAFTYSFARGVGVVLIEGESLPDRPHIKARWALKSVSKAR